MASVDLDEFPIYFCYFEDTKNAFSNLFDNHSIKYDLIQLPKIENQSIYLFVLEKVKNTSSNALVYVGIERFPLLSTENIFHKTLQEQGIRSILYYISFDDELIKIYTSDRLKNMLQNLGFKEGESISHNMIDNSVTRAQEKIAQQVNAKQYFPAKNISDWLQKNARN